jgi:broad specificity phosphatase PhoE
MTREPASFQRRPFLTPIWLTAIGSFLAFGFLVFVLLMVWTWGTSAATTVIVIRHAEKDMSTGATDPPLTAAGAARAELLARMFGDARQAGHIDAIYVSPALRNRLTAAPLAARLGINPIIVAADDPRGLARRVLREHRGQRILIIGHSDTLPQILAQLSGQATMPELADEDYGSMYVVGVPRFGRANLLRLSF